MPTSIFYLKFAVRQRQGRYINANADTPKPGCINQIAGGGIMDACRPGRIDYPRRTANVSTAPSESRALLSSVQLAPQTRPLCKLL